MTHRTVWVRRLQQTTCMCKRWMLQFLVFDRIERSSWWQDFIFEQCCLLDSGKHVAKRIFTGYGIVAAITILKYWRSPIEKENKSWFQTICVACAVSAAAFVVADVTFLDHCTWSFHIFEVGHRMVRGWTAIISQVINIIETCDNVFLPGFLQGWNSVRLELERSLESDESIEPRKATSVIRQSAFVPFARQPKTDSECARFRKDS